MIDDHRLQPIANIVATHTGLSVFMEHTLDHYAADRYLTVPSAQSAFCAALDMTHELGHWIAATPYEREIDNWGLDGFAWWRNQDHHDLREAQACYFQRLVIGDDAVLRARFLSELSDSGRRYCAATLSRYSAGRVERAARGIPLGRLRELWATLM